MGHPAELPLLMPLSSPTRATLIASWAISRTRRQRAELRRPQAPTGRQNARTLRKSRGGRRGNCSRPGAASFLVSKHREHRYQPRLAGSHGLGHSVQDPLLGGWQTHPALPTTRAARYYRSVTLGPAGKRGLGFSSGAYAA